MKNYTRHKAHTPTDIFKDSYEEIIKSAKRKHSEEFFLFYTTGWYSECSVDVYGDSFEHWKKEDGKWKKQYK